MTDISAATWLDHMANDEVLSDLIHSRTISFRVGDKRIGQARSDLIQLLPKMESASMDDPMRRSSCDEVGRQPCPFQAYCWSPVEVSLADLSHLYKEKTMP